MNTPDCRRGLVGINVVAELLEQIKPVRNSIEKGRII